MMNSEILFNESSRDYHANPALSKSKLDDFIKRPSFYALKYIHKEIKEPENRNFIVGSATHSLILEGREAFEKEYYLIPVGVGKRTIRDKAAREALALEHPGKDGIEVDEFEKIKMMQKAIQGNLKASFLVDSCKSKEVTFRASVGGVDLQCRPDGYLAGESGVMVFDLKTTAKFLSDDLKEMEKSILDFNYHIQASFYSSIITKVTGKKPVDFRFIFVEKNQPHECQVISLSEEAMDIGNREVFHALERFKGCQENNLWPGLDDKLKEASLPAWYVRQYG